MANLPTMPRRSWLERTSLVLGCVLTIFGAVTVAGWLMHIDAQVQLEPGSPPIVANAALSMILLGVVLVLVELGLAQAAWAALLPAAIGLATLLEQVFGWDLRIDELLAHDNLQIDTASPGRMGAVVAGSILLASVALVWRGAQ